MAEDSKTLMTAMLRLRFPEFRGAEGWKSRSMGELYSFMRNNSLARDKLSYESGKVKNIHYGDIHTKLPALFDITKEQVPFINGTEGIPEEGSEDYCVEGDIIFADASEDTNDVGKSMEVVHLNGERLLSGQHTILARRKDDTFIIGFGGHLFRSGRIRSQIQKESQGTKVYGISATRLGNIDIAYPCDKVEQQKIADCLTSLDEVISAQGQKVETLKVHKKGLMQQLFPREGESLPRLRFPEFRDAPEWETPLLEEVAFYENGKAHENSISEDGRYIVVNSKFISTEGGTCKYSHDALCIAEIGDVLMVLSDVPNGKAIAKCYYVEAENLYTVNQRICKIKPNKIDGRFLFYILNRNPYFLAFDDGVKQTNLRREDVCNFPVLFPPSPKEQKQIGDFIFSLDIRIAAELKKHDAMKNHKMGLLQQLFPSPEGQ